MLCELRANGTNDHSFCPSTLNNKTANHHVVASLYKTSSADVAQEWSSTWVEIVHFHESNSGGVVYAAHDGCVIARLQVCNNRRLACRSWSVATILNIGDLIAGDNATEYR